MGGKLPHKTIKIILWESYECTKEKNDNYCRVISYFIEWLTPYLPIFFMAVGSQANVGGAASAPIVASAFHPSLAPVGVLLAVLGYAVGTYGAWFCGMLMQVISH